MNQGLSNGFDKIDVGKVALDAAIGGVISVRNGLEKGVSRHLMTQGKNAVRGIAKKGVKKAAKYYFSQTYTLFYKDLIKDIPTNIISGISTNVTLHYIYEVFD